MPEQQSHLGGGSIGIGGSQTGSLTDAACDVIGGTGYKAVGVDDGQHGHAESIAQADKAGSLGHAVVHRVSPVHQYHSVAADGCDAV